MKPQAQRIAIAKASGWTQIENCNTMAAEGIWRGYPPSGAVIGNKQPLPDYLSDLNAMHEAEKTLDDDPEHGEKSQWRKYRASLMAICERDERDVVHATGAQRAEAFLRTLGLWTA